MNLELLHQFWFGRIEITNSYYQRQVPRWFFGNAEFDRSCEIFTPLLSRITPFTGESPREHLSKILLFDQIPRNSYRDNPAAHAFDLTAQHLCLEALGMSLEYELSYPEKLFLYLPLEHSEELAMQDLSVLKFSELHAEAPANIHTWTQLALRKAREHRETIRKFGRFPQRNKRLGRDSSMEELAFLTELNS